MAEPEKCPDCGEFIKPPHYHAPGSTRCLENLLIAERAAREKAEAVVDAVRRILPPGYPDTPEGMIRFLESGGLPTARAVPAADTKAREP